jgi:hypothetical protein
MKRPFIYGELAEDENFIDRIEDRKQLKTFLGNGVNVTLISPRRWGKSSLVKATMKEMQAENSNMVVCFIDAFRLNSEKDFYNAFASAVVNSAASTFDKGLEYIKRYLQNFSASFKIKGSFVEVEVDLKQKESPKSVEDLLNLPQVIAEQKGVHIIMCIDEFQRLADFPEWPNMEGMLRSVWQHQQDVTYCLYGSKRHMLMDIFTNSNKPFYRFGQTLYLKKIATEYWVEYIVNTFKQTGKEISKEWATRICESMENHSWYVQQMSFFVWADTETSVTEEIFYRQLQSVIDTNMPVFESETDKLALSQIAMLRAIVAGEQRLNSNEVVRRFNLGGPQTITRNKGVLINLDILEKQGGKLVFVDPLYKLWFKQTYCG